MNKNLAFGILGSFLALFLVAVFTVAGATAVPKITWCHVEPNGNQQTLELPQAALENAGHMDANGNPLHAGDHAGACVEPTATPTPTITVSPTPIYECNEEKDDCIEITPTPTATPTPTETPNQGGPGDGLSDGKSDGQHTGPDGLGCATHECKDNGYGTGNPEWYKLPLK